MTTAGLKWACLAALFTARLCAALPAVIISEFMAENNGLLLDSYGESSDWLELQNTTGWPVPLAGWSLTDNASNRAKWILPSVVLPPWGTLLIRASGKDRADPAGELHTNFSLSKNGEYLGLYDADRSLVHDYSPAFSQQYENISFGFPLALVQDASTWISNTSPVSALCPGDDFLGDTWRLQAFDDAAWLFGLLPVGFATKNPSWLSQINLSLQGVALNKPGVYLRVPFFVQDAAAVQSLSFTMAYDDGAAVYINGMFACGANTPPHETLTYASYAASILGDPATLSPADISACTNALTGGQNILAVHLMNANASSSDLFLKPALTAVLQTLVATNEPGFLLNPTPGAMNGDESALRLPQTVAFSQPQGILPEPFTLALTGNAAGQSIRYTTDGAEPALTNSALYEGPFTVTNSSHLRARVFDAAGRSGMTATAQYTFHATDSATLTFATALPILVIRENDPLLNGIPTTESSNYTACTAHLIEPVNGTAGLTDAPVLTVRAGVHVRGSSSAGFPKKPFALTFWGEDNDDKKVDLTGFPSGSDFALISCYNYDRTYMHDALMFDLSRQIGWYAPRTRWVELFLINNERDPLSAARYNGLYVLEERVKAGNGRVPIDDIVDPGSKALPDVTGSYLFKCDRVDYDEFSWRTARNFPNSTGRYMVLGYPKLDTLQAEQAHYIVNAFQTFEDTLYGTDPMNPETGVARHIDLLSWADFHIMKMYSMDVDIFTLSSWFHKDRGGKIMAGPVWDFDRSLGPYGYNEATYPNVKRWDAWTFASEPFVRSDWWGKLHAQPAFQRLYWDRWHELRKGVFSSANLAATISRLKAGLPEAAATRDYVKWNQWPSQPFGTTHSSEVQWLTWFATNHADWIDQNLYSKSSLIRAPTLSPSSGTLLAGGPLNVMLTATEGNVLYYTLDGTDPALWNNLPHPGARACASGVTLQLTNSAALFVRAFNSANGKWSLACRGEFLIRGRHAVPGDILISEIHYHPNNDGISHLPELLSRAYEFVEILNISPYEISLSGCRFPEGEPAESLTLTGPILKPGEHAVVARHSEAFAERYGAQTRPAAYWAYGSLSDGGETVTLLNRNGLLLDAVAYRTKGAWPSSADGEGDSLNRVSFEPFSESGWQGAVPNPGRGGFPEWLGLRGIATLDGDDDGDGVPNLVEYYTGADPLNAADRGLSDMRGFVFGPDGVSVSYHQAFDRPDAWASLQESSDLLEWYDIDTAYLGVEDVGTGYLWTLRIPPEEQLNYPRRYFRLRVWPATFSHSGGTLPPPL